MYCTSYVNLRCLTLAIRGTDQAHPSWRLALDKFFESGDLFLLSVLFDQFLLARERPSMHDDAELQSVHELLILADFEFIRHRVVLLDGAHEAKVTHIRFQQEVIRLFVLDRAF